MSRFNRFIFYFAMTLMGIVSMWTTYVSLHDSILPKPVIVIPNGFGGTWECSVFALMLSVAIGLMLFALKVAIINDQKHLTVLGVVGLTLVGFVSIAFNMDVLYRTADRDFYLSYANQQMRGVYDQYLADAQKKLLEKQLELRKIVAKQEGEIEAEIKGLREAPAGYGPIAKQEDYKLTLMVKQAEVELQSIDQALLTKVRAEQLLAGKNTSTVEEIQQLQNELRVTLKDMGVAAGLALPNPVQTESPLFVVFKRLTDYRTIGVKEVFFLILAFLLDLGDILGYVLVPTRRRDSLVAPVPMVPRPALPPLPRPIPVFRNHNMLLTDRAGKPGPHGKVKRIHQPEGEYEEYGEYVDDDPEDYLPPPRQRGAS